MLLPCVSPSTQPSIISASRKKSEFIECLLSPKNGHARPQALKVLEIRKQGWQEVVSFARGVPSQATFSLNIHFLHVNMLFAPPLSRLYFPPHCRNLSVARHVVRDERLQTKEEKLFLLSPHRFVYTSDKPPPLLPISLSPRCRTAHQPLTKIPLSLHERETRKMGTSEHPYLTSGPGTMDQWADH